MSSHWRRVTRSWGLALVLLLVLALLMPVLGGPVLLLQGGAMLWVVVLLVALVGLQLLVFRLLGLRSDADEEAEPPRDDSDWRAWRG